jgi:hypothetical protein
LSVAKLVRSRYADFDPTLAAEVLFEKDGIKVSRETLRRWMVEDGLWLSRKQRRNFHQPRSRREAYKVETGVTPNKKGENTRFPPLKECFGYLEVHSECSLSGAISGVLCGLCPDQGAKG